MTPAWSMLFIDHKNSPLFHFYCWESCLFKRFLFTGFRAISPVWPRYCQGQVHSVLSYYYVWNNNMVPLLFALCYLWTHLVIRSGHFCCPVGFSLRFHVLKPSKVPIFKETLEKLPIIVFGFILDRFKSFWAYKAVKYAKPEVTSKSRQPPCCANFMLNVSVSSLCQRSFLRVFSGKWASFLPIYSSFCSLSSSGHGDVQIGDCHCVFTEFFASFDFHLLHMWQDHCHF